MTYKGIIEWLIKGDVSIQYQTRRDLLNANNKVLTGLRKRIEKEGWGKTYLEKRGENGLWGNGVYSPKWISTHYTLMDLKSLCINPNNKESSETAELLINRGHGKRGDLCITGMSLGFYSYFRVLDDKYKPYVDYILDKQFEDGGWNCRYKEGATHSSVHTTINILEGLLEFRKSGHNYRKEEIMLVEKRAREFLLEHRLFKSHRTGEIMNIKMTRLSFPTRWYYDILRALEYFRNANAPYDERMNDSIKLILKKRRKDGTWPLQQKHRGRVHFDMEKPGKASRWNTLRALRTLKYLNKINY
ncbi:MAG: hypothetical protein R6U52_05675 [Kosmotogaceae bacterium]